MSSNGKNKPATTLESILEYYRQAAQSNRDLGDSFERLVAKYLLTDPQYADRLSDVWLWSEWPDRWNVDVGIDLVARGKRGLKALLTASGAQMSTTCRSRAKPTRQVVPSPGSMLAVRWLMRTMVPMTVFRCLSSKATFSPQWKSLRLGRGGGCAGSGAGRGAPAAVGSTPV